MMGQKEMDMYQDSSVIQFMRLWSEARRNEWAAAHSCPQREIGRVDLLGGRDLSPHEYQETQAAFFDKCAAASAAAMLAGCRTEEERASMAALLARCRAFDFKGDFPTSDLFMDRGKMDNILSICNE